jgi:hypothetical protein
MVHGHTSLPLSAVALAKEDSAVVGVLTNNFLPPDNHQPTASFLVPCSIVPFPPVIYHLSSVIISLPSSPAPKPPAAL